MAAALFLAACLGTGPQRPTPAPAETAYPAGTALPPVVTKMAAENTAYLPVIVGAGGTAVAQVTPTPADPPGTPTVTGTATPTGTPTDTPTPTMTPTPRWPPALETPGLSKVALHLVRNDSPDIMEFMRVTKPPVVKSVDDFGFMAEIKEFSPTTVTVGRILLAEQPMDGDPIARAQAFVAQYLQTYLAYPAVDYWEGYNEPNTDAPQMQWYAQFEAERVRQMAAYGLRTAIGAFATGTPEFDQMVAFLPAVEAARQYGGILALHEYAAPTMDYAMGSPIPGQPAAADRGPFMLRYRFYYDGIFKPRNLVLPLVISEAGIDGGITNRPGPDTGGGWQEFRDYWQEIGLGGSSSTYIDQLAWYDQEVQRDDYVIGFTVFTVGGSNHPEWRSFDITQILTRLARYVVTQVP